MILPRFGKWNTSSGVFFIWERIYIKAHFYWKDKYLWTGWTPFCRISKRYYNWFGYFKAVKLVDDKDILINKRQE